MPEENPQSSRPRFAWHILKALFWVAVSLTVTLLASFVTLNYFGEHFIKKFLQTKVKQVSHGVYAIDFETFHFNLFSGKTEITGFQLIPDEQKYEELRKEGKVKSTLYSLDYEKLTLNRLDVMEMVFGRAIHLRMIELDKPTISFIAYPDSTTREKGRFKLIYKDIYPLLSTVFSVVKIDSIRVNDGSFSGKQTLKSGQTSEGNWLYSAVLRDFDLNATDAKEERVFYSKDVELRIRNFNYTLADSLYFLTADEVGFSLKGTRLFGKGISLTPNLLSSRVANSKFGSFYQVYLPEFSLAGIDLYKAMLEKQITINSISIDDLDVNMFMHRVTKAVKKKNQTKVTIANLYTIFAEKLKNITIDTFLLNNASFDFFQGIDEPRPELQVESATLQLHGFQLDSLAYLDTTKILYARDIEFDLTGFTLALEDKLHDLNAQRVMISTRRSLIDIYDTRLYPSPSLDSSLRYKSNSIYRMFFPQVKLENINLLRMFNTRNLEFERLSILEPDMTIIQYRDKRAQEDTALQKETFLQKMDLVKKVVKPYLISIQAGLIEISNARISFKDDKEGLNEERIGGLADLTVTGFRMDTLTHPDKEKFLNKLEVNLRLKDFRYLSPDSLHRVRVQSLFVNSLSEELDVTGFELFTTSKIHPGMAYPSTLVASFSSLQVHGFDHRKWISKRWFSAGDIVVEQPEFIIRSVKRQRESSLNEPFANVDDAVSKIEIGNIRIDRGLFDLVEEDHQSRGSLLIRKFDFQLSKFLFDLTGWDEGVKLLRYDLLSLKPDTTLPIIIDSSYTISFTRFLSDSYPPNLMITDLHLAPMENRTHPDHQDVTIELKLPSFIIQHLELEKLLFDRDLLIEGIRIAKPEITLNHYQEQDIRKKRANHEITTHPELKTPFISMIVGRVDLSDGIFRYNQLKGDSSSSLYLDNITTTIQGFRYDSTHTQKSATTLFFSDDIDLSTGGYSMLTKDSMNTLSISGVHLSTANSTLSIDSFALVPNYSNYEYSRKLGYQTDRMEMHTTRIEIERLDFNALVQDQKVIAGLITVTGFTLDDYRDKRVNFPYWKRPPMIQQAIRKLNYPVTVDTVKLINGKVTYREQTGEEPGMIFFDRLDGLIRNVTTDPVLIARGAEVIAHGSTYLMGKAKVEGEFRFPMQSPADTFLFTGKSGLVDMTLFNPMVSRVAPVKIRSGVVDSVNIHWMRGNGVYSNGILDLYYHDLSIELLKEKRDFWNRTGTDLAQVLVNMVVPQENPGYFGIHRRGYIWNRRDEEKGYFNFFWKSILSGLKSSEGLNSKEQRAFKKDYKKRMGNQ